MDTTWNAKVKVQDGLKVQAKGAFAKGLKDGTVYTLQKAAPHGGEDTYSFVAKGKVVARFPESAVERFLENGESGDSNGLVKMASSTERTVQIFPAPICGH